MTKSDQERLAIDVWSDVMCPFCYMGDTLLAKALEQFPHADQVDVRYRSYQLLPHPPVGGGVALTSLVSAADEWARNDLAPCAEGSLMKSQRQQPIDNVLAAIAREKLGFETLETRKRRRARLPRRRGLVGESRARGRVPRGTCRREGGTMKTLGTTTTYDGTEHAYLRGHKVRIVAVLKNALRDDYDPDQDGQYLCDEDDLERAGGVTADDRVEVQPWLAAEGRFSFVASDPRAIDLACFASLKR